MMFRRSASVLGTIALVLTAYSTAAAAHGVDVTAEIDGATATLELTDETGEVCVAVDPAPEASAVLAVVRDDTDEVLLILGEGFNNAPNCQFFDVDIVNGILDDVDAHRLVVAFGSNESSGVLTKPRPPDSETALADGAEEEAAEDSGLDRWVVFAVGAGLGLTAVVVRKRFLS